MCLECALNPCTRMSPGVTRAPQQHGPAPVPDPRANIDTCQYQPVYGLKILVSAVQFRPWPLDGRKDGKDKKAVRAVEAVKADRTERRRFSDTSRAAA